MTEPTSGTPEPAASSARPFGVAAISVIVILNVAWGIAGLLGWGPAVGANILRFVEAAPLVTPLLLVIAAASVVGAFGLWLLRPWGWVVTMLAVGFGLGAQLFLYWAGSFSPLRLLLWTVAAFYLNQREVRAIFEPQRSAVGDAASAGDAFDELVAGP